MGRKLAGIFGILAATLAFGIGATVEAGHSQGQQGSQHVLAESTGPTSIGV